MIEADRQRGWWHGTNSAGIFWILPQGDGLWRVWHGRTPIGRFTTPDDALAALVEDECAPIAGVTPSRLSLPTSLARWSRILPGSRVTTYPPDPADDLAASAGLPPTPRGRGR